jgi:hypothetical protein
MNPEKNSNLCPKCHKKTEFVPIGTRNVKGKAQVVLGRYKCSECDWQSELQEPKAHQTAKKPKNTVYMIHHYYKEGKRLFVWVYTTEKKIGADSQNLGLEDLDRHLLTVEVTPHSIRICPNVPFSIQSKRVEEGLMFLEDNKELVPSLCSECSSEQKNDCLNSGELCKKLAKK